MGSIKLKWREFRAWIIQHFPEHQVYLRTNGRVRYVTLGPGMQVAAIGGMLVMLVWVSLASWSFFTEDTKLAAKDAKIWAANDRYDALTRDMSRLEAEVLSYAQVLESRQKVILSVLEEGLSPEAMGGLPVSAKPIFSDEMSPITTSNKNAMALPEGTIPEIYKHRYETIGARQSAFVAYLRDAARAEVDRFEDVVAQLGLSAGDLLASGDQGTGVGGPLIADASGALDTAAEDPVAGLVQDWAELKALRAAAQSLPAIVPVDDYFFSSPFGRRKDPITKNYAFHSGVDLGAWYGSKVKAATDGRITFVGYRTGYGKMVEIDHGNGFKTRYGHLRKTLVKRGQQVALGDVVAESGSTGRATGPHLHYEIWRNGKLVDPKPFIEAAEHVYEIQQRRGTDRG